MSINGEVRGKRPSTRTLQSVVKPHGGVVHRDFDPQNHLRDAAATPLAAI